MKKVALGLITAFLLSLVVVFAYLLWASPASTDQLRLHVALATTSVRVDQSLEARLSITNQGRRPVTLVRPGDGSESGWRTPTVTWRAVPVEPRAAKAGDGVGQQERCGNIDPLRFDEVFILRPGQTREFTRPFYHPGFSVAGVYEVSMSYLNEPSQEWQGGLLGRHNRLAMLRLRNSTRCDVESSAVVVTVADE